MNDQDSISRREKVFEDYRSLSAELDQITDIINKKYNEVESLLDKKNKIDSELSYTYKLIETMIMNDCCPVEAKLKYPENLEPNTNERAIMNTTQVGSRAISKYSVVCDTKISQKSYNNNVLSKIVNFVSEKIR